MLNERIAQEIALLRTRQPDLMFSEEAQWVLLPRFQLPPDVWQQSTCAIAFQIPLGFPGQKPYGFCVSPRITPHSDQPVQNRVDTEEPPFDGIWAKFSWDAPEW